MSLDRNDVAQKPLHVARGFAQRNIDKLGNCAAILKGGGVEKQ